VDKAVTNTTRGCFPGKGMQTGSWSCLSADTLIWERLSLLCPFREVFLMVKIHPTPAVAHTSNPNYLGGWGWEDWGSRPAQAKSS
jgi:hypothetical protein